MQHDPTLVSIREVRHRISKQFDHDPKKLVEHYMRLQEQHKAHLLGLAKDDAAQEAPGQA